MKKRTRQSKQSDDWKEAVSNSGYGLDVDTPDIPKGMKLFDDLSVSWLCRRRFQRMLVENWTLRPESLTDDFTEIAGSSLDIFPNEIVELIISQYKRRPNPEQIQKKCAELYIRHEWNRWILTSRLKDSEELGCVFAIIHSSGDIRVCEECKRHAGIIYPIKEIPEIPICWDCRCYYQPILDVENVKWPAQVYNRGKIRVMTDIQFIRKYKFRKLYDEV